MGNITFCTFDNKYAKDFKEINLDWIKKYFIIEPHDIEQLSNPQEYIINAGGEVLFALDDDKVVGTCALIKTGENEFELAKMGVSPQAQGKHIGYQLGMYTLKAAKALGAKRIWLESNRRLAPALNLYTKLGFKEVPVTETPYARADIRMELWIEN